MSASTGGALREADNPIATRLYSAAPWANLTGSPISALNHLVALRDDVDEVGLVLCVHGEIEERARAAGVPVWCFPLAFRGLRKGGLRTVWRGIGAVAASRWRYVAGLSRLLKEKPGLLHIHSRAPHLPYALLAAFRARVPVVVTIREPWVGGLEAWVDAWMIRLLADHVVFLSQEMARQHPRCLRRRHSVVFNYAPPVPARPPSPVRDRPVVAMPARLGRRKGVDVFLEICRRLHEQGVRFDARLIGDWESPDARRLAMEFIRANRLDSVVTDLGLVPDMAPVYAQTDLLLLPARRDPLPRVVMEAMCWGIPVVASRVDGIPEMVEDGVTGLLAPPEDAAGFAAAADRLLKDPELRRRMGAAGRDRAQRLFSPDAYRTAMRKIYRRWLPAGPEAGREGSA